jgi:hypothetical protein
VISAASQAYRGVELITEPRFTDQPETVDHT